jgi:DTW domain-containing protein YfiP
MGIRGSSVERCKICGLRPLGGFGGDCICAEVPRIAIDTQVIVFVHAHDVVRPSNTGRLVAHMLSNSSLIIHGGTDNAARQPIEGHTSANMLVLHPDGRPLRPSDKADSTLLVPDGTWGQTRRMLRRLQPLRDAERVSVTPTTLRKGKVLRRQQHAHHLCTLEAVATALGVLGYKQAESDMIAALEQLTARAFAARGARPTVDPSTG